MIREGTEHKNINLSFKGSIQVKGDINIQAQLTSWVLDYAAEYHTISWAHWERSVFQNKIYIIYGIYSLIYRYCV